MSGQSCAEARTADDADAMADHIRRLVDTFPLLGTAQRDQLAALLRRPRTSASAARPHRTRPRPSLDA